jgi:hypothetical protein
MTFRKLDLFPSSGEVGENIYPIGPLGKIKSQSLSKNQAILYVIQHRQNQLVSTSKYDVYTEICPVSIVVVYD